MKRNFFYSYSLLCIVIILNGCAANLTPIEVTDKFWAAVKNNDKNTIKKYISKDSIDSNVYSDELLQINNYSLGRTVIDKQQAWVDTTVEIAGNDPFELPIKTVLLQENSQWKIDYKATVASISGSSDIARFLSDLNEFGLQFSDKLNKSLDQLQKDLPKIQGELSNIEENIKQRLPELQKRMDELMRQLEEALGNGDRNKKRTPAETREI